MNASILLVEDDPTLGFMLKEYLELKGFELHWAENGRKGLRLFDKRRFDLCLLDVMMPEMDGFTLAKRLRKLNSEQPIIFLTAKSMKIDKLKGFDIGADDYIVKPVDEEELIARIRAVLRRTIDEDTELTTALYKIGDYEFDVANQKLTYAEHERYLTEMEAHLLRLFCEKKGQLLARQEVLQTLWGKNDYFSRRSMDVFISRLRKYLAEDERIQITNVHGSGFILQDE